MALLAAIVVVTNTVLVSVTTRTREIGVRRALGATRGQILREVLAEAVLVAVVGGRGRRDDRRGRRRAARRPGSACRSTCRATTLALGVAAAAASGILAGWYPARRATRLDVIAALRSE